MRNNPLYIVNRQLACRGGNGVKRLGLFLSAYAPLLGILAARFTTGWLCGCVPRCSCRRWPRPPGSLPAPTQKECRSTLCARTMGRAAFTYLLTYALPFAATSQPRPGMCSHMPCSSRWLPVYVRSDMQQVTHLLPLRTSNDSGHDQERTQRPGRVPRRLLPREFRGSETPWGCTSRRSHDEHRPGVRRRREAQGATLQVATRRGGW